MLDFSSDHEDRESSLLFSETRTCAIQNMFGVGSQESPEQRLLDSEECVAQPTGLLFFFCFDPGGVISYFLSLNTKVRSGIEINSAARV